ncbi:hypothetical protein Rrhod_4070 [Rhodococcus rhodnii LMG 5362]|uniref:Uncharacterized protein n=2 Tax=Rhodococcus rhodnii TaxID=38312 RepID=R7WHP7_9NOCA|nr:hypothetical protein Rrhod_4070 [Rhodococcus rhodnii LMG 5362]
MMSTSTALVIMIATALMALATVVVAPRRLDAVGPVHVRYRRRADDDSVGEMIDSVCVMRKDELETMIESLFARERALRAADRVDEARAIGLHKFICISELRSRRF